MSTSNIRYQAIVDPYLPWDPLPGENRRITILTIFFVGFAVVWMFVQPFVKIPEKPREQEEALPATLAKVVLEEKQKPPPPKEELQDKIKKPDEVKPKAEEQKATPKEELPPVEEHEAKAVTPDAKTQAARARAKQEIENSGIQDQLASLRDMNFDTEPKPAAGPGAGGPGNGSLIKDTQAVGTSRNLLTSRAGSGSGGLAAGGYGGNVSSGFGGGKAGGKGGGGFGLAGGGDKLAKVESDIGKKVEAAKEAKAAGGGKSGRTEENIQQGFDSIGSRVDLAYQKALRDNPTLQGTVTVALAITPDGSVTSCSISATELNSPELEAKICVIVKGHNFGAEGDGVWNGKHQFNFLPGG